MSTAGYDESPLLSSSSEAIHNDGTDSYGSIEPSTTRLPPITSHIQIDHDVVVNHGHAYTDAVLTDAEQYHSNADCINKEASYWGLIRDNTNFRWYLMSYLVTHAGE